MWRLFCQDRGEGRGTAKILPDKTRSNNQGSSLAVFFNMQQAFFQGGVVFGVFVCTEEAVFPASPLFSLLQEYLYWGCRLKKRRSARLPPHLPRSGPVLPLLVYKTGYAILPGSRTEGKEWSLRTANEIASGGYETLPYTVEVSLIPQSASKPVPWQGALSTFFCLCICMFCFHIFHGSFRQLLLFSRCTRISLRLVRRGISADVTV